MFHTPAHKNTDHPASQLTVDPVRFGANFDRSAGARSYAEQLESSNWPHWKSGDLFEITFPDPDDPFVAGDIVKMVGKTSACPLF